MRQQAGIPARMTVTDQYGATAELSGAQMAAVNGALAVFRHKINTSIIPNLSEEARIPDGVVQMRSIFGTLTARVMVMLSKQNPEKVLVLRFSGIGIQMLDADGAILRVLLQPQGTFGKSTGKWTEKRIEKLHGGNQVWQSSLDPNDYGIVSADSVMRNNADAGKVSINAKVVFSARTTDGKKFVVAIRNIDASNGMQVVFYKGAESLSKLKGDSVETLAQTAQMTLPKWNVIEVHPNGTRFLAWRFAQHESASGRVYATYADKMAWFTVGDGTVTEAEDVGVGAGFTVHHADPALPYPDAPGQVIPTMGSFSYDIVTGAHIDSNGVAVVHKNTLASSVSDVYDPGSYSYVEIPDPAGTGIMLPASESGNDSRTHTASDSTIVNFGDSKNIETSKSYIRSFVSTSFAYLYLLAQTQDSESFVDFSAEDKNISKLYDDPKNAIFVFIEKEYSASISRSRVSHIDSNHTESSITHHNSSFSGYSNSTVKVSKNGIVLKALQVGQVNRKSFSYSHSFNPDSTVNPPPPPVADEYRWLLDCDRDYFKRNYTNLFSDSANADLVAAAHDPLTGAVVAQIVIDDVPHWLVIDDTGVRDISAVSKLIPATSQAQLILSV